MTTQLDTLSADILHAMGMTLVMLGDSDTLTWHGVQTIWDKTPETTFDFHAYIRPSELPRFVEAFSQAQDGLHTHAITLTLKDKRCLSVQFLPSQAGQVRFLVGLSNDHNFRHDSTDQTLLTRPALCRVLEGLLLGEEEPRTGYVMTIGLDRISLMNQAYGAAAVDHIIEEAGFRLRSSLPVGSHMARISGDIFAIVMSDMSAHRGESIAVNLIKGFASQPFHTSHGPIRLTISIGGLALNGECMRGGDALSRAEIALSRAKSMGGGCFHAYHDGLQNTIETRGLLGRGFEFLQANDEHRLVMAYQPVIHSDSGDIAFYESLIRMVDKTGRMVPAGEFIPVLEQLGFARMADRFTLKQAVTELDTYPDITLSVNVSNWSLNDPQWLRAAAFLLEDRPDLARRLIIEITESVAMKSLKKAQSVIQALQSLGCSVALDDFGAGYTSFKQIKNLNVDMIKIDQHFVRHIDKDENVLFIRALQSLADGMGITTVAEGAESQRETEMLQAIGLNYIQGYAVGHPSPERLWLPKRHEDRQLAKLAC